MPAIPLSFRLRRVWFLAALGIVSIAVAAEPAVSVKKAVVSLERRTFDPRHLPPEMPPLKPTEAGLCAFKFECQTWFGAEVPLDDRETADATVTAAKVWLTLKITLWTKERAPPKLVAHEEGHRTIAELFYVPAESIAQDLAEKMIGRKFPVRLREREAVMQRELKKLQEVFVKEYLDATGQRCIFAQERFDVITNHGLNSIPERDAMAKALAEERAR